MVRLDIAYGEKLALTADIAIMFRTLPALVTQIADTRKARRAVAPIPVRANGHSGPPCKERIAALNGTDLAVNGYPRHCPA